jgi:hypothetical protein
MRPAARFGLARVVEARSSTLDPTCVHQCVAWARLAHKVRSVPTLKKALGVSAPSVLREYWLLPDSTATALQPHLYRALVLAGNTYSLLGEEGLNTIQFKYQGKYTAFGSLVHRIDAHPTQKDSCASPTPTVTSLATRSPPQDMCQRIPPPRSCNIVPIWERSSVRLAVTFPVQLSCSVMCFY